MSNRNSLHGSVKKYEKPLESVAETDWDAIHSETKSLPKKGLDTIKRMMRKLKKAII